MTQAEIDALKMEVIRFLARKDLPRDRLQLFESTRDLQIEWKQQQERLAEAQKAENNTLQTNELEMEYISTPSIATIDTRISDLIRYLLEEISEEDELIEFQLLCNDSIPPCLFTIEEQQNELRRAVEEFERGEGISHEEVLKRMEGWI